MLQSNRLATTVLENGLTVHYFPDATQKSLCVGMVVFSGSRNDPPHKAGLHHVAEHLPFRGSRNFPSKLLLTMPVERCDGGIGASTHLDRTEYYCTVHPNYLDVALTLIVELVFHPLLRSKDWEEEKSIMIGEYHDRKGNPRKVFADHYVEQVLFGGKGFVRERPETIEAITIEDIRSLYEIEYSKENMCFIVTGHVPELVEKAVSRALGGILLRGGKDQRAPHIIQERSGITLIFEDVLFQQPIVSVSRRFLQLRQRERTAMHLFCIMMADTFTSPLFQVLREEKGLVYSYDLSDSIALPGCSEWEFNTTVSPDKIDAVVDEFWKIVAKTREDRERFAFAKDKWIAHLDQEDESAPSRFHDIADELNYNSWIELGELKEHVASLTLDEVQELAAKCFDRDKSVTVIGKAP